MYNITQAVKNMFDNNYVQQIRIHMDTVGGSSYDITENDILAGSFSIDRYSVTGNRIEVGTAVAGECSFRMKNYDSQWDRVSFEGAQMYVTIRIADWSTNPSESDITIIPCGYFTVDKPVKNAQILEITALDRMARFDRLVDTNTLAVSYTPKTMVNYVCSQCGVLLANGSDMNTFPNNEYVCAIPENVAELTYRNLLQGACMLMGVNAFIDWQGQLRLGWYDFSAFTKTAYGNPFNPIIITDGAENRPVKDCTVEIEPIQSGSGDPSPTNVRSISGWAGVQVTRTGKNILPDSYERLTHQGVTGVLNSDGSLTVNGTTGSSHAYLRSNYFTLKAGTYTLNGAPTGGGTNKYRAYLEGLGSPSLSADTGQGKTFTVETDAQVRYIIDVYANYTMTDKVFYPMLRYDAFTINTYEQYIAASYNVNLSTAGTVYGGTLDVTTGLLTVDRTMVEGTSSNIRRNNAKQYYINPGNAKITGSSYGKDAGLLSNQFFAYESGMSSSLAGMCFVNYGGAIRFNTIDSYTSVSDLLAALGTIQFVYPLANPQTYQLTPQQITTLLKNNTLVCDCGDITLTYYPDVNMFENIVDLGDQMWGYGESDSDFRMFYNPDDRIVYVNGTTIRPISYNLSNIWLEAGTYSLYGMPTNMPGTSLRIHGNGLDVQDTGHGVEFTVTANASFNLDFCVDGAGYTFNDFQFYPKIYTANNNYLRYDASKRYTHSMQEKDITITGVIYDYTNDDNETTRYISGTDDYAIDITDNPFVHHETAQDLIVALASTLVGFTYRPLTMSIKPSPYLYPMDVFEFIASGGNIVVGIVTKCTFGVNAHTHVESNGETNEDNGYATYGNYTSIQSKILEKAKTQVSQLVNERTTLLLNLNEMIANSLGLNVTAEPVTGGGYQYYFHDGTTLASSNIIYTFTANGLAWTDSWNGGSPAWQYGITRDGNAILNMLNAYKISADIISGGVLMADVGNNYWNLRTGEFYNSIVTTNTRNVQNYILNPLLNIRTSAGETVPDLWGIIGSDTAEVVNDPEMGVCWHFISTNAKCGARNNAGVIQIDQTASKVYVGANVKVVQSGHYSNLGYKVRAQLTVQYSDNTTVTLYSEAYVDRLNTAQQVTFEFEPNSSKTIKFLDAGFYNTFISTQETTQETYYADMWCSLVNVSESESFTINATPTGYQTSTIDYVEPSEVGHVLMNEEKAEFVGTRIEGSNIISESGNYHLDIWGGVQTFKYGNYHRMQLFQTTTMAILRLFTGSFTGSGETPNEYQTDYTPKGITVYYNGAIKFQLDVGSDGTIVIRDGNGHSLRMSSSEIRLYNSNTNTQISLSDTNGLGIYINGSGYNNLGWVDDGNGHAVLGK